MQELAVLGDTHIPERATEIPSRFQERIQRADHVVHTGDFTVPDVLDDLESLADGPVTAVAGNMDPGRLDVPNVATLAVEDVTVVVTHGTGSPESYEERVAGIVRDTTSSAPGAGPDGMNSHVVGIAGHTHAVLVTTVDRVRLLNPGSVTGAAPADRATMITVAVADASVSVTIHE